MQGGSSDGSLPFGCAEQLRAAVGAPPCQGILVGAAGQWDYKNVVPAAGPGGGGPANQNGGLQCVDLAGQSLDGKLGRRLIRLTEALPPYQPALGLQLQGLQQHVPVLVESLWDPGHAVPDSSQWTIDRPQPPVPVFARRAKKGAVEGPQIGGSLRKERQAGKRLGKASEGVQDPRPRVRAKPWGVPVEAKACPPFYRNKCQGKYVMDLFSGAGGVGRAVARFGYRCKQWDLNFGKEHDLTDQIVLRRILSEIRKQRVLGVIMDPPLRTFSTARDRQHPIRDRLQPWGVHHSLLSKSETADIERDNQCLQACLRIIRELDRFRIPYLLAQPASSKVWWLPEVVAQQSKAFTEVVASDTCQFGTKWRRRLCFLAGHFESEDLHRMRLTCSGPHKLCSRTSCAHSPLTRRTQSTLRTPVAAQFPSMLCTAIAYGLTAAQHSLPIG